MRSRSMWATVFLTASIVGRLLWVLLSTNGANFVDLHVYRDGAAGIADGSLYSYAYDGPTATPLPFTYPPFAAVVFYPLSLLPWDVVAIGWQFATIAALYASVVLTLRLCGRTGSCYPLAATWTAAGLWCEPVRVTLDYGQINVFLMLGALFAVTIARTRMGLVAGGALIGLMAGIKLTPAISGLWYLAVRRPLGAVAAAAGFAATVAGCLIFFPGVTRTYFDDLLGDADRIGEPELVMNQSLRGALSRMTGHDVGSGWVWLAAVAVALVLAVVAWRSVDGDWLAVLLVVQLLGLLVSPISWVHHWVWLVPLAIWLAHGPGTERRWSRAVLAGWIAVGAIGVPWLLRLADQFEVSVAPAVTAVGGAVWPALALVTMVWLAATRPRATGYAADVPLAESPAESRSRSSGVAPLSLRSAAYRSTYC
ncbi:mannosyltransferase [Gordonia araii]|uniref:mannosyltransferase n=1 Tax=Gordonia araii TaxID=263909 RepID=UPI001FE0E0D5|nr:mannosyltransferase [Gordonia araii]